MDDNVRLENLIAERKNKKIYRHGNLKVKVFDSDFKKSDILNEALNQARVEETGLSIPALDEVCKINGNWAIVTEFVEGRTLADIISEDRANLKGYMEQFVDIQMEIHSKRAPLLNKLKDKMHRKISESSLSATTRYELHTRLEGMPTHNKVCHGDFNPSNVIIAPDGRYYVIDWSHATQGNASADAARTYLLFSLAGDTEAAEMYMDMFCKKSDTAKQYVWAWLPIVAASQSVKGNADEREFLLKWADVVDYE